MLLIGPKTECWYKPGRKVELPMKLLQADLRCLDVHSHLANLMFVLQVKAAMRHYDAGVKIGDLSLGAGMVEGAPSLPLAEPPIPL